MSLILALLLTVAASTLPAAPTFVVNKEPERHAGL